MDTTGKTGKVEKAKHKGFTTILLAGVMGLFLILFFVVGIDFARIYYVKGELQNAADAAALAGAALLDGTNSISQSAARAAAVSFAGQNNAAGTSVGLASNGDNTLSDANDILVGNWDGAMSPAFDPARTPVNAVQVRARRTANSPGGPVGLLFGNLVGWSNMSPVRTATATYSLNMGPLPICLPACNTPTPLDHVSCSDTTNPDCFPGVTIVLGSSMVAPAMGWTNFTPMPQSGVCPSGGIQPTQNNVIPFIDGSQTPPNVCGKYIQTTQGGVQPIVVALTNRWLAERAKPSGTVTISGRTIQGWHTAVPVVEVDACGSGPTECPGTPQRNPYHVTNYSEVVITYVGDIPGPGSTKGVKVVGFAPSALPNHSQLSCSDCSIFPSALISAAKLVQ